MPKISVIMPCYNCAEYISDAIDSVIKQTFNDWELIIIDDGSTDNSSDIVKKYMAKDSRIKYIYQQNAGVIAARNNAIAKSDGKYIFPLDADDIISPDCLEKMYDKITHSKYSIIGCEVKKFGTETGPLLFFGTATRRNMYRWNCICNGSLFYKSDWELVGGYDSDFSAGLEDHDFWLKLIDNGCRVYRLPYILYLYRIKPTNLSRNSNALMLSNDLMSLLKQKHPRITRYKIYRIIIGLFYKKTENRIYIMSLPIKKIKKKTTKHVRMGISKTRPCDIIKWIKHPLSGTRRNNFQYANNTLAKKHWFCPRKSNDLYDVPVYIISYDRLSYVKQMVEWLQSHNMKNIHIIDNNSSYPPLLDYLQKCPCTVHYMTKNWGHDVFWRCGEFEDVITNSMYIVTDPDIAPNYNIPKDFLEQMYRILGHYKNITKVGFALQIDNLPKTSVCDGVHKWESRFWEKKLPDDMLEMYLADIDTTFALYRPGKIQLGAPRFYHGIRIAGKYTAMHLPWYKDKNKETDEDIYYRTHVDMKISTWVRSVDKYDAPSD